MPNPMVPNNCFRLILPMKIKVIEVAKINNAVDKFDRLIRRHNPKSGIMSGMKVFLKSFMHS